MILILILSRFWNVNIHMTAERWVADALLFYSVLLRHFDEHKSPGVGNTAVLMVKIIEWC